MDSLSSAPGNRNSSRLLSAAFAIAASVSGAVNAATAPNFTEEPAGSPKIISVADAQKAILDMLPLNHPSRPGIQAAIKKLEDGGNIEELKQLYTWALTIANSPSAPPAAKEKAEKILSVLVENDTSQEENQEQQELKLSENPKSILGVKSVPINETPEEKEKRLEKEKKEKILGSAIKIMNKFIREEKSWGVDKNDSQQKEAVKIRDNKGVLEFLMESTGTKSDGKCYVGYSLPGIQSGKDYILHFNNEDGSKCDSLVVYIGSTRMKYTALPDSSDKTGKILSVPFGVSTVQLGLTLAKNMPVRIKQAQIEVVN